MEWNEEVIARLRALWDEGLSTAEIGRRLGVSKNAVVGKAHRLGLPPRPSPIRRATEVPAAPRPRAITEPTLASLDLPAHGLRAPDVPAPNVAVADLPAPDWAMPAAPEPTPPAPTMVAPASVVTELRPLRRPVEVSRPTLRSVPSGPASRVTACCWPIGEPGTKAFTFCDAPSAPGKPYCQEHVAVAYVKVRDRREDAA